MKFKKTCVIAGCASTAFLFGSVATADTVTVTGTYIGANGTDSSVPFDYGGSYGGNPGAVGYTVPSSSSTYVFNNATITGGNGGAMTSGVYPGGYGSSGLYVPNGTAVTINSGSYTGGTGGNSAAGRGQSSIGLYDAYGGPLVINGGTFNGGGLGAGGIGGDAVVAYSSSVTVFGGTFIGGVGATALGTGGNPVSIYGGTFTSLSNAQPALEGDTYDINVYGSNFAINGVPVGYGPISQTTGTLTGVLEDNLSSTSITFATYEGSVLDLAPPVPVPEPAGLSLLTGGMILLDRRSRRRA